MRPERPPYLHERLNRGLLTLSTGVLLNGGYEDGYRNCSCFWGRSAGSLVRQFLSEIGTAAGLNVLDLGCGEGKNAYALASAGANVVAVDCSQSALANGQREFAHVGIQWVLADAETFVRRSGQFDLVVMYGLLHCLPSLDVIETVVGRALEKTRPNGRHFVVAFNDGPHDLSAHPAFHPTLGAHTFYLNLYADHRILVECNEVIHETHPHNGIPHFHSLTRLVAEKHS